MRNVPQSKYDVDYYVHNCDGYTEDGSMCRRLQTLASHVPAGSGRNIIDIGAGRGEISKRFADNGDNVLAVDYSYAACQLFGKAVGDKVPFLRHDISQGFAFLAADFFHIAILADVIEHLYDEQLRAMSDGLRRIMKQEALVLIDTPIMQGGESELHVDIKESAGDVMKYFPWCDLVGTHWHKKPEHCNLVLVKK